MREWPEHGAALSVAALLVALPWATWFVWWGYRTGGEAAREIPLFLYTALALMALGGLLTRWDLYLGLFVAYTAGRAIVSHTALALAVAHWVTVGAIVVTWVRAWPAPWRTALRWGLVISGALECLYTMVQAWGGIDPLWSWTGWRIWPAVSVHGTLDHPTLTAAMLAMLTPLAPVWLLPLYGVGLYATHSLLATTAAILGVLIRWRARLTARGVAVGAVLSAVAVVWRFWGKSHDSYHERVFAWKTALLTMDHNWGALLFGFGAGGWYRIVPQAQLAAQPGRTEVFYQGHNELLQFFFEGGVIAVALLVAWVYTHRTALFASGSAVALMVLCTGTFPWHVAPTAVTALAVLALALGAVTLTGEKPPAPAQSYRYWM